MVKSQITTFGEFPEPEGVPFDADSFWTWIGSKAKKVGTEILEKALMAMFVVLDPKTPHGARINLIAALAYLMMPIDAIPDFIPVVGFTDDLAALLAALYAITNHVRVRHLRAAREAMDDWGIVIDLVPAKWDDDARLSSIIGEDGAEVA